MRINMSDTDKEPMREETDVIEVADGNIGTFNKAVYLIISIICIVYLILFLSPP